MGLAALRKIVGLVPQARAVLGVLGLGVWGFGVLRVQRWGLRGLGFWVLGFGFGALGVWGFGVLGFRAGFSVKIRVFGGAGGGGGGVVGAHTFRQLRI